MNQLRKSYKRIFKTVSVFVLAILMLRYLKPMNPIQLTSLLMGWRMGAGCIMPGA